MPSSLQQLFCLSHLTSTRRIICKVGFTMTLIRHQLASKCRTCTHLVLSKRAIPSRIDASAKPQSRVSSRCMHSGFTFRAPAAPKTTDRGPVSDETTQTRFNELDIYANTTAPTTAVDTCMDDGFALNSGLKVTGSGVILIAGEAFKWRPWIREGRKEGTIGAGAAGDDNKGVKSAGGSLQNKKGQLDVAKQSWGVLDLAWPKPDLLILGTGRSIIPLSPETRRDINNLGIRVEVQDTRNAAAQFNMLATERGVQQVAAALIPIGWREGR